MFAYTNNDEKGKSNPRKMVIVWPEKELRNYRHLHNASIPYPDPILLKSHAPVMKFLGSEGRPSPRIKDATLSDTRLRANCSNNEKHVHMLQISAW